MADESSYIDHEAFLDANFSPQAFANALILNTNNPSDTPLDLSTPLSRVLFDVQEIDSRIHVVTTKSAIPLLTDTKKTTEASGRIVEKVDEEVKSLTESYKRLEKEILQRYEAAEQTRLAAERLWQTVKIGRSTGRALGLGRQLEVQMNEIGAPGKKEDHRALVRASNTLLTLRELFDASGPDEEGEGLEKVQVIKTLRQEVVNPAEVKVTTRAQQIIREFSMSSISASTTATSNSTPAASTFSQVEDTKARTASALNTLYLLSPVLQAANINEFRPSLLLSALQSYIQTCLTSSFAGLSRALAALPLFDRTLLEVSARCQNIVALEALLEAVKPPEHPLFPQSVLSGDDNIHANALDNADSNLLQPLLSHLDTTSLPSHFWRSLASSLSPRVEAIVKAGGVSARTLKSNKDRIRDGIRECVVQGSQPPTGTMSNAKETARKSWERESAVMVGSVIGHLGR